MNKKNKALLISFLLPIIIYLLSMLLIRVYPFGDKTLIMFDLNNQYISFLNYFIRAIKDGIGGINFFYSFGKTIGGEMIGLTSYYLLSPFNLVLLLFNENNLMLGITVIILLKFGCMGMSFAYTHFKGNVTNTIIASTSYALMGYSTLYFHNIMWMDGLIMLPLIIKGIHDIKANNRIGIYVISLSFGIIFNYYIGFMLCIFSVIYFIGDAFYTKINKKSVLLYIISSILAGMISAIILVPTLYSLMGSRLGNVTHINEYLFNFNVVDIFKTMLSCVNTEQQLYLEAFPPLYTGLLGLIILIIFLLNYKKYKLVYFKYVFIIISLICIMLFVPLDYVASGMTFVNNYMYRYAFVFSFVISELIIIVVNDLNEYLNFKVLLLLLFIIIIVSFSLPIKFIIINLVIISLLFLFKNNKKYLLMLVVIDLFVNSSFTLLRLTNKEYIRHSEYEKQFEITHSIIQDINNSDDDFYRVAFIESRTNNDPLLYGYNGLSHFSSAEQKNVVDLLNKLGFSSFSNLWASYKNGVTKFVDSLFGIKYIISERKDFDYQIIEKYNDYFVYKNNDINSIGILTNKAIDNITYNRNPFEFQNSISEMIDSNIKYNRVKYIVKDGLISSIETNNNVYLNLDGLVGICDVYKDGVYIDSINSDFNHHVVNLERVAIDNVIELRGDFKYTELQIYEELIGDSKSNCLDLTVVNNKIFGDVKVNKDSYLMFTIPYDKGWKVKVDNKFVDTKPVLGTLLAIPLSVGNHNIDMSFYPQGLNLGFVISSIGVILFIFIELQNKRRKKL